MEKTDYQFTDNLHDKKSNLTSFNLQDGGSNSKIWETYFNQLVYVRVQKYNDWNVIFWRLYTISVRLNQSIPN